jgi:serine/threonine protein kinase
MELGDDIDSGREMNPVEYEPRTLRGDHHQGTHLPWPVDECIDVGIRLAEALDHLHRNGLAHRDVKPSNVIFVNGKAKLADIGLVAAPGFRQCGHLQSGKGALRDGHGHGPDEFPRVARGDARWR